jgi:hypothetical protein
MAGAGCVEHCHDRRKSMGVDFGGHTGRVVGQPGTWIGHVFSL